MTPDEIDEIPYFDQHGHMINHKNVERDEQMMVKQHIPKDATVLELGARYGTVSCMISSVLNDPYRHVAVEPDVFVLPALIHNKLTHEGKFHILVGAISRVPLKFMREQCGYGNFVVPGEKSDIETFTLEEIEKRYDLKFDCLVADCEGFLEQFFKENPTFASRLKTVIFEADRSQGCDYNYVRNVLSQNGLTPVVVGFQNVWIKNT
jgi:FkbM family methyltransferase